MAEETEVKQGDSKEQQGGEGKEGSAKREPGSGGSTGDDFVSMAKFKGALETTRSQIKKELEAAVGGLRQGLADSIKESVAEILKARESEEGEGAGKKNRKEDERDIELKRMKRELEQIQKQNADLAAQSDKFQLDAKTTRKRGKVTEALAKSGCESPDVLWPWIDARVDFGDDGEALYATVKNEFGGEDKYPLDEFIAKEVREKYAPGLFKGSNRSGSPAAGDAGDAGSKRFKFDWRQVRTNPEILNSKEFQDALDRNEVANAPGERAAIAS